MRRSGRVNKREKGVRAKKQKILIKETHTQFDRLIDNLVTGKKNLVLAFRDGDEMNRLSKMAACDDYLLEALEDVVTIRYAFTELAHRYWKIRRLDKEKAERLKLMKTPTMVDVEMPSWMEDLDGQQQGSETQA